MTWFRVDDGWHSHPKVLELSLAACGLWAKSGSWCSHHLTDGRITAAAVRSLGGSAKLAQELVDAGLWLAVDGGWQFHQWNEHQPLRGDVEEERRQKRERQQRWRGKRRNVDASTGASTNASQDAPVTPAPVRASPVPSRPVPEDPPVVPQARPPEPGRLVPLLHDAVRAEAFARGVTPAPHLLAQQARAAAERAQQLLTDGKCATSDEAVNALVAAGWRDHERTKRPLAFCLLECVVTVQRPGAGEVPAHLLTKGADRV